MRATGYNFQNILSFSLRINFVLANSADPDEMQLYAAFHLGLHCLLNYPFWGGWSSRGLVHGPGGVTMHPPPPKCSMGVV